MAAWRNVELHPLEAPLKMSMLIWFQTPKDIYSKIYWPCSLVFCELPTLKTWEASWWENKNTFIQWYNDECHSLLKYKERAQDHKDVPFLVVLVLGYYWETGTDYFPRYRCGHRWGCRQSYWEKWNSGQDLERFGDGLEVFQKRVPDWPPFAAIPPASAANGTWMSWTPPAAVTNVLELYFIQIN